MTADEKGTRYRWIAVGIAIITGAGMVLFGYLTGEQWATLVGGLLAGGGALARPTA